MKTSNRFPCSLSLITLKGGVDSLYGLRGGAGLGVKPEGRLWWSAHPSGGGVGRGQA